MSALGIIEPRTASELDAFHRLNRDYLAFLLSLPPPNPDLVRTAYPDEKFAAVLAAGNVENRPPRGIRRLVLMDDQPVGCGTIQTIGPGDAEIKRVYIAPEAQGRGAGRALMLRLIADCRELGFRRILMDTGRALETAAALYDALGFKRRGPYTEMPPEARGLMVFFEMPLD